MCRCFLDLFLNLLANWAVNIDQVKEVKGSSRCGKAITRFGLDWSAEKRSRINISRFIVRAKARGFQKG